jgi:hypothetical protein
MLAPYRAASIALALAHQQKDHCERQSYGYGT